jgi:hypothetical protein
MLVDPFLIWSYRLTGYALVDFLLGTFVLAWIALLIGEVTISAVFLVCRQRIDATTHEARRYQDLSMEALSAGDKQAYQAANKMANEAFGKSFFMQIALSAARLWPVFLAVAWMGNRFAEVEFPLLFSDYSIGFVGVFIPLYAAACLIFKRIKYKLPYFRRIKTILDSYDSPGSPKEPLGGESPRSTGDVLRQA